MRYSVFLAAVYTVIISVTSNIVKGKFAQKGCDIFEGKWVMDNAYPYYQSSQCPFIEAQFDCRKNGRPDDDYTKYRWQPAAGCTLPRFNGVDFLRRLKGKKMMFVGDSLSLNQWQSLTCMVHVAVPNAHYILTTKQSLSNFTFPEYEVSILFYRNAFLVDINIEERGRVLRLDSISSSQIWGGMDFLIFDSWHWWLHNGTKQPWDWVVYGNRRMKDMDRLSAYEIALNTWSQWIDANLGSTSTRLFFQGVSPDAGGPGLGGDSCEGERRPVEGRESPHPAEMVLEKVLRAMGKPVFLLNITHLSEERRDGHPSVYGHGGHRDMDCTHWCLSGVPDIWNECLYYSLLN